MYGRLLPDVGLLDLRMPVLDGVETITAIRKDHASARLLLLTTFDWDEAIYRGLRAGARAYLLKDAPADDLLNCIRDVHAGRTSIPPHVVAKLTERLTSPDLTPREMDVLRLMTEGRSNKDIGAVLCVSEGTVKVHVNSILEKLHASSRTEAVGMALRRGIIPP